MSNEFDDVLDLAGIDDPGVFDLPAGRGRLFAALGWAAVGPCRHRGTRDRR